MRKLLLTASLAVVAFAPAAYAQEESDEDTKGDEVVVPEGGATVVPGEEPAGEKEGKAGTAAQHTVEKGDTLWDLSQRFLGSPWYWPKVWSYNPEIANPHWIYPGNLVRFFASGEEVPTQVEVGQPETENVEEGQIYEDDQVVVTGQIGYRPKNAVSLTTPGFITSREVEESGKITASFAEQRFITFPSTFYATFKKPAKLGETYVVFRNQGEVFHPITKEPIGHYTRIVGEARVVRVEKNGVATMAIVKQQDPIERGDLIGPMGEPLLKQVAARPAERDVKGGVVVGSLPTYLTVFAEHHFVVVDKGSDDGVKNGNVFHIWRQHDPLPQEILLNPTLKEDGLPREDVGQCVAFEVKSKVTVCLMSRSLREIVRGDEAEVRSGNSSPKSASR